MTTPKGAGTPPEILPCPFCGNAEAPAVASTDTLTFVECEECGARGPEVPPDGFRRQRAWEAAAIHDWNRRPREKGTATP